MTEARRLMPGGVSSPARSYDAVGLDPIVIREGKGAIVTDVDGNSYIDYVGSYGPLILGHAPDGVLAALSKAAARGTSFGMPTEGENKLAQMVVEAVDSIDLLRFVNSGTEATMSAIRLARAATGRSRVIKCIGCYHGHSDALLVQAGSGALTLGVPSSPGVPETITANTILVSYNDLEAVRNAFEEYPGEIAAMCVEPVAGNMGCIPPAEGYLQGLRELCDEHGALLLFDEVMTGFRVHRGGAQALYGVKPDLTCLGKVLGGGLPCAAYGGREDLMRQVAPDGPVYQAGTLSGNPLAMAAGIATLTELAEEQVYKDLEASATALTTGMRAAAKGAGVDVVINQVGSMLCCFMTDDKAVTSYEAAKACDTGAFARFFNVMLEQGVLLPPSQYECWFISTAHTPDIIDRTIDASRRAFNAMAEAAVA